MPQKGAMLQRENAPKGECSEGRMLQREQWKTDMEQSRRITGDLKTLLKIAVMFGATNILARNFINVFLIRSMDNILLIVGKEMLFAMVTLIAFVIGTKLLSKINVTTLMRKGALLILLYYLALLLLQNWLHLFIVPLGIVNGFGNGLYWLGFNIILTRQASDENRGTFFGLQKVFNNLSGIFIPTIAGFIIVSFTDFTGYYILFIIAVLLLVWLCLISFKIAGFKSEKQLDAIPVLKVKGNKYWDANKLYSASWGFGMTLFTQTFALFAFAITASELRMGNYNSLMAIISLFSAIWVTRTMRPKNRKNVHRVATVVYFVVLMSLGLFANEPALLMAIIGVGLVQNWGMNIAQAVKFQLSTLAEERVQYRTNRETLHTREEFLVATEFPIAMGRIAAQMLALVIAAILPLVTAYRVLIIICSVCWIFDHFVVKFKVNWFEER